MAHLTEEEQEYLDDKFESFKLDFWKRFKIPAIGLAVVFAGLISVFSTYLYMQAKINVMQSQEELTKAKVTFYEGMMKANKEITDMVTRYNTLAEEAGASVGRMKAVEAEFEEILVKHKKMKSVRHGKEPPKEALTGYMDSLRKQKTLPSKKQMVKVNGLLETYIASVGEPDDNVLKDYSLFIDQYEQAKKIEDAVGVAPPMVPSDPATKPKTSLKKKLSRSDSIIEKGITPTMEKDMFKISPQIQQQMPRSAE